MKEENVGCGTPYGSCTSDLLTKQLKKSGFDAHEEKTLNGFRLKFKKFHAEILIEKERTQIFCEKADENLRKQLMAIVQKCMSTI